MKVLLDSSLVGKTILAELSSCDGCLQLTFTSVLIRYMESDRLPKGVSRSEFANGVQMWSEGHSEFYVED